MKVFGCGFGVSTGLDLFFSIILQSRTWEVLDWGEYFSDMWALYGPTTGFHYVQ